MYNSFQKLLLKLVPIFFAQIDLEINKLSNESIEKAAIYPGAQINMNGIKSFLFNPSKKLIRLICFLNQEGPRKNFKKENFNKATFFDSTSLKGNKIEEKMEYSHNGMRKENVNKKDGRDRMSK